MHTRIRTVYRTELISILRDRRTIMAMIIVPVVLYPLLMIGFLRAVESDKAKLEAETFTIEVPTERQAALLRNMLETATRETTAQDDEELPAQQANFDVVVADTPTAQLGDAIHLAATVEMTSRQAPLPPKVELHVRYTEVSVRSRVALSALTRVIDDYNDQLAREVMAQLVGERHQAAEQDQFDPATILEPVKMDTESVATQAQRGGWALGQVVPMILVLMTITGAIYPAIDLTAGERERGTLEALLATPTATIYLVVGKFLVVATLAMTAAIVNVSSIALTMHLSGVSQIVAGQNVSLPLQSLPIIALCMVPFALLSSAILMAACSFARSFREAQNYVMPVMILALIPAVASTLPSAQLEGIALVIPVGNMVLLTRELLQQTQTWHQIAIVLISTSLYAAAAIALASRVFGQEAVMFADSAGYRTMLKRRLYRPRHLPTTTQALLLLALLFPATFHLNSALGRAMDFDLARTFRWLAITQFLGLYLLLPIAVAWYLKIDIARTFSLHWPRLRMWLAAICIGLTTWTLAHEFAVFQSRWISTSESFRAASEEMAAQMSSMPVIWVVLLIAIVPGICEEFLFRGFLLSGLRSKMGLVVAILISSAIFGVYHAFLEKVFVTALIGAVLAFLCVRSGSIGPNALAHVLHNSLLVLMGFYPAFLAWLDIEPESITAATHLPLRLLLPAILIFIAGIVLAASGRKPPTQHDPSPSHAEA